MARIAVCTAQVPFVSGGAERHAAGLVRELGKAGHEVELVQLPWKWYPRRQILLSAMSWRLLDLSESDGKSIDLVIPMKFPSYVVSHPNKVVWLIHQFRQAYDRFGTAGSDFDAGPEDTRWRELIAATDETALTEARKIFTNAENTAQRLARWNGIKAEALYHPPPLAGRYRFEGLEPFALIAGRLDPWKRVDLAIEAAAAGGWKLVVAGRGPDLERLSGVASRTGASVDFLGGVSDEDLISLYARAGVVVFPPADEDYGYIALEAFLSRKPVVTCTDSGGPLEFVSEGETGRVVAPEAARIASAVKELLGDSRAAARMGETGYERVRGITWENVVTKLLAAGGID